MTSAANTYQLTRIAPTPSGYLHVGNVLSFVITAALAEKHGAEILLRIDDLDQQRVNSDYVQDIFDTLDFLGIHYHKGPRNLQDYQNNWSQLHRMESYAQALTQLAEQGIVFACTCSRSQIRQTGAGEAYPGTCIEKAVPLNTANASWRLKTERSAVDIHLLDQGIIHAQLPDDVQQFVVRKKDGFPAYQLASVIDDGHLGVDLVVRGQDLWSSTIAQVYLAKQLHADSFLSSTFYHHQLITNATGIKLSKSAGDTAVQSMRKQDKTAADIYTVIANLLGHNRRVENWQQLARLLPL